MCMSGCLISIFIHTAILRHENEEIALSISVNFIDLTSSLIVSNSRCQPSCLVADSILSNILREEDSSLDAVKCSFLSYLFEVCWDTDTVNKQDGHHECRPSVDKNMKTVSQFYRSKCIPNNCFALFFRPPEDQHRQQQGQLQGLEKIPSNLCSTQFQSLLQVLLNPSCNTDHLSQLASKMGDLKECAEQHSTPSCRRETSQFMDNFMKHMQQQDSNHNVKCT